MAKHGKAAQPPGEHLVQELLWVHGILRRDLRVIRQLADEVTAGSSGARVNNKIRSLRTQSPLWQLRSNCLRYCSFVHAHHGGEDASLFPALRRADRSLGPTVDRLEADHRKVSDLLDQVQALADLLGSDDGPETRGRLADALRELAKHLLEHLDFEEKSISPTLRRWHRWPW